MDEKRTSAIAVQGRKENELSNYTNMGDFFANVIIMVKWQYFWDLLLSFHELATKAKLLGGQPPVLVIYDFLTMAGWTLLCFRLSHLLSLDIKTDI